MMRVLSFVLLSFFLVKPSAQAGESGVTSPITGSPLTLLLVAPTDAQLSPNQKIAFDKIKTDLEAQSVATMPTILGNFSQVLSKQGKIQTVLADALKELSAQLAPIVQKVDRELDDEAFVVNLYVLPWSSNDVVQHPKLQINGAPAPLPALRVDLKQYGEPKKYYRFYDRLNETIQSLTADPKANASHFNFYGAVAQIRLARGYSQMQLQLLGSLKPGRQDFIQKGDDVNIDIVEIPSPTLTSDQPLALASLKQRIDPAGLNERPQITIEFGKWGGISGGYGARIAGQYLVFRDEVNHEDCSVTMNHVPSLIGSTQAKAFPVDLASRFLKGSEVQFRIFSVDLDPVDLKVTQMDVRMKLGPLKLNFSGKDENTKQTDLVAFACFGIGNVNTKFSDKANEFIQDQLKSFYKQDDLTDDILNYVYQN